MNEIFQIKKWKKYHRKFPDFVTFMFINDYKSPGCASGLDFTFR